MPDYTKPPVFLTETKLFKAWLKEKNYPNPRFDEIESRIAEFYRDALADARCEKAPTEAGP